MLYGPNGLLQINYDSLKHSDGDGPVLDESGVPLQLDEPVTEANINSDNCTIVREKEGIALFFNWTLAFNL